MTEVIPSTICYAAIQVRVSSLCLMFMSHKFSLQAYVALCSIEKWGEKWQDINLERLYILLREQLALPNDTWVVETLKWWNQFRACLLSVLLYTHKALEKCSVTPPKPAMVWDRRVNRAQRCESGFEWRMNGKQ